MFGADQPHDRIDVEIDAPLQGVIIHHFALEDD